MNNAGMEVIRAYNKLVPAMNTLIKLGYEVNAYSDCFQGYGYRVECKHDNYINVKINLECGAEPMSADISYTISCMKHNSKLKYDILNDKKIISDKADKVYRLNRLLKSYLQVGNYVI